MHGRVTLGITARVHKVPGDCWALLLVLQTQFARSIGKCRYAVIMALRSTTIHRCSWQVACWRQLLPSSESRSASRTPVGKNRLRDVTAVCISNISYRASAMWLSHMCTSSAHCSRQTYAIPLCAHATCRLKRVASPYGVAKRPPFLQTTDPT